MAQLLAYQPLPRGQRVAVVGNSDALGLLAADAATAVGLTVGDPVSLGAYASADDFERALDTTIDDPDVDAVVAVYIPPLEATGEEVANVLAAVGEQSDKPIVSTFLGREGIPELLRVPDVEGAPGRGSVPSYSAVEGAVRALARVAAYSEWLGTPAGEVRVFDDAHPDEARRVVESALAASPAGATLEPEQTRAVLAAYGVGVQAAADEAAPDGVAVRVHGFEDPLFGPIVSFGVADATSDLLDDRAYRIPPITDADAAGMVREIRSAPLLTGYRGAEPVDMAAIEDLVQRVARLKSELPRLVSIDVGPAKASAAGVTVLAAEARVGPVGDTRGDWSARRLARMPGDTVPH